jgi:hypothetical protein
MSNVIVKFPGTHRTQVRVEGFWREIFLAPKIQKPTQK